MLKRTLKLFLLFPLLFSPPVFSGDGLISKDSAIEEFKYAIKSTPLSSTESLSELESLPAVQELKALIKKELGDNPSKKDLINWINKNQDQIDSLAKVELEKPTQIWAQTSTLSIGVLGLTSILVDGPDQESFLITQEFLFNMLAGFMGLSLLSASGISYLERKKTKDNKKCLKAFIEKVRQ